MRDSLFLRFRLGRFQFFMMFENANRTSESCSSMRAHLFAPIIFCASRFSSPRLGNAREARISHMQTTARVARSRLFEQRAKRAARIASSQNLNF